MQIVILFHAFTILALVLLYPGKNIECVVTYMMYFPGALYIADRQTFLLLQKERIKRRWETGSCKEDVHYWKILSSKPTCERHTAYHSSAGCPCPVIVIHRVANTYLQNRFCATFNFTSKFTFLLNVFDYMFFQRWLTMFQGIWYRCFLSFFLHQQQCFRHKLKEHNVFLPLERFLFQCAHFSFLGAHSSLWSSSSPLFLFSKITA